MMKKQTGSYILTPKSIVGGHAIINVENRDDNECFKWAITSAIYPEKIGHQRLNQRMREDAKNFDWTGIHFPPSSEHIDIFEENNPYAINVLVLWHDGKVYSVRLSKKYDSQVIYLLILYDKGKDIEHYCWVKDINKLLTNQITRHCGKSYYCSRCLTSFISKKSLDKHLQLCGIICRHEFANFKIECDICKKECHHGWQEMSCRDCKAEKAEKKKAQS